MKGIRSIYTVLAFVLTGAGMAVADAQVLSDESLKFSYVLNAVDRHYVDSVNKSELVEDAISEMLKTLDPHSTYLTKEEVKETLNAISALDPGVYLALRQFLCLAQLSDSEFRRYQQLSKELTERFRKAYKEGFSKNPRVY